MKKDRSLKIVIVICSFIFLIIGFLFERYSHVTAPAKTNKARAKQVSTQPQLPGKYIYLTFDDGPLNGSENIDSIILAEKLKVNVFLVGRNVERSKVWNSYYELYKQNPYVEMYNHSFTHANNKYDRFYKNPSTVLADIEENEAALDLRFKIVRLPGRNIWRIGNRRRDDKAGGASSADTLVKNGYEVVGWDLEWFHNNKTGEPKQSVNEMYTAIAKRLGSGGTFTKNHLVLLLHDEMFEKSWEESELKELIDTLRTNTDYTFEHIRFYPDK